MPISDQPTPVSSSNIAAVWYKANALFVEFRSGGVYRYDGVSEVEADDLLNASSPGGYFHRHIKDSYAGERVG
jgi:hypothetical protein